MPAGNIHYHSKTAFMKKLLIILYLFVLLVHVVCRALQWPLAADITKPLLMPLLITMLIIQVPNASKHILILFALLMSWFGDIALMFAGSLSFMIGLAFFLAAHILYITWFFRSLSAVPSNAKTWQALLAVTLYAVILFRYLLPHLQDMLIPVLVYTIVIASMVIVALWLHQKFRNRAAWLMATGAILFVLSDSILAINKFALPFDMADALVMITYGIAQLLITLGVIKFIPERVATKAKTAT